MKRTIYALLLIPVCAMATNTPNPPPFDSEPTNITVGAKSASEAKSVSIAAASAESSSNSSSTATATQSQSASGGDQQQTATGGSADNAGNTLQTVTTYQRQAPSTAQGSLMIGACGAGGNAGGSNTGGSAFLGIAFVPGDCKLLLAAAAYQALGMGDSACEMVNGISAVKKRWKALGVEPPKCEVKQPEPVAPVAPVTVNVQADTSKLATKEDVARAFERSVAK